MHLVFIDRENELNFLEQKWKSSKSELVIIYGRRGIGKTELIKRFMQGKNSYYFFVTTEDIETLLESFMSALGPPYKGIKPRNLEEFFNILGDLSEKEKLAIIFDEFQRLTEVYKGALSLLQKVWDEKLSKTKIFVILVGSSVSVLERIGKSYDSPLYGRRTGMLEIKELDYWAFRKYFRGYSEEDKIRTYTILGGTPLYMSKFDDNLSLKENISSKILEKGSELYDEPEILLLQETRDPAPYMSILRAIAKGHNRFSEISDISGIERHKLPKYLDVLMSKLRLVERIYPIEEKGRGLYYIKDNFLRFWFRYILPHKFMLELGKKDETLEIIMREIDNLASKAFEEISEQFLLRINGLKIDGHTIKFNKIGRWWKKEKEIDLIAINELEKKVYFIECKYASKPVRKSVLFDLTKKVDEFKWKKNERDEIYVIFSKSGFTFEGDENTILLDLESMVRFVEKNIKIQVIE
ncbi:MAG: ATP-binding protein [Candidatus Njordarchaeum guaymaensis]